MAKTSSPRRGGSNLYLCRQEPGQPLAWLACLPEQIVFTSTFHIKGLNPGKEHKAILQVISRMFV